ncbi:hypothetical protein [Pseudomonas sp. MWU12-2323]|uniref:hypothetical protein n=1 Tax=Pseudomonas sp. MWU12-2323 TaxID=2651296 RepID=UPI00128DA6E4|nr:hypothetical protein [Pseudomonas sp. MWU12-2323]MPQ69417.1 hypothetical protein [Pseudomonas sp. MWU12-2323]
MSSTVNTTSFVKEAYLQQLDAARRRIVSTKRQTLDWVSRLDVFAASEFIHIEPMTALFPSIKGKHSYRLVYDIHTTPKRYGTLGVSLRSETMRTDLSKLTVGELSRLLSPHCGALDAKDHATAFQRFKRFNDQVAALRFLGVDFLDPVKGGALLPRWFEAIHAYGLKCRGAVEAAFDQFIELSAVMDEVIFEFNATMGAVRYRSIRCSYTVDDFDLLGPSNPALKVVTSIDPATRRRRYNLMADFKKSLKKKRMTQQLRRQLGRDPQKIEVAAALSALRPRKETDWITKDVIKACYLGRSINDVFQAQENLVAVMQRWTDLRAQLQALLP